ncbi:MAG: adenylate/guanylate cyclase domain-containing protein [Reinekea sp.]|nr:adenylate/guanylate cyclase domain-containing protein [Reinekea sp.]
MAGILGRFNRTLLKSGIRSNRWVSYGIALLISSIFSLLAVTSPGLFRDLEGNLLDARFKIRGPVATSGIVELVSIDEKSIDVIGRWPWSRDVLALLIDEVSALGATTIGLDIIFSEPQRSPVDELLLRSEWTAAEREKLEQLATKLNPDVALATSIFMADNVVNGHFFYQDENVDLRNSMSQDDIDAVLLSSRVEAIKSRTEAFSHYSFRSVRHNIPYLAQAGHGAGFFNQLPSEDGVVRNALLVAEYGNHFYPSLALKSLAFFLDDAPIVIHADEFVIQRITLGDLIIPTNEEGMIPINYRGPAGTIPTHSAVDVLNGQLPPGYFQGKVVLLGSTAVGVFDSHATPFGAEFPGLEIQANVLETIVNEDAIHRDHFYLLLDIVIIFVLCLLLAVVVPRTQRTPTRFLFFLMLTSVLLFANYYAFSELHVWLYLLYPGMALFFCFVFLMLYQAFMVEARYSHVRTAFKSYLSPALVDQLTANPDLLNFGGEEKELSILFSDIRSFTNLSETVTPSELSRFLQAYMDPMTDCVLKNNGTLDKYIGDAVMAIFGAPVPFNTHAVDACQTALDMIKALDVIVDTVPDLKRLFPVRIGVGVHTGTVVVGNLGSSHHFNYTVIGDSVNLASRIEGLTKNYGVDVMISEATYTRVREHFVCRELDLVRVKGKQEPVGLYELIGRDVDEAESVFLQAWHSALTLYRNRQFTEAKQAFEQCQQLKQGNYAADVYVQRCNHFIENPVEPDWDGVFTFTTK